ncbi:electron transfer flavoprotein subunit alpha [Bacillus amyloliquefaciens]|jgi:electron transfer flavoprotein alpha subunit|uniref:Electron transfer flavoprotein (Alpha subunit) n=1 Tax=Bacillus amyloliquefaciens (strain ATCC 23350 / DSM 7 / BCRC 11601 / CCUG 28519 / NBRC 15535 / NRRL B-14393 / F) TaxID=692420 RepID=A0A9P1JJ27_BACAS|nr:electron transfer flavoprotein subunit alpha/FixB family protein [Bacillus amyloliquefaciens]ARW39980.1 Electron transfer flavoprotein subunit alpha [Bacillus amyloliquefaciens]AZV90124.1 electron transfer flavoprotein subunit alpha [Bacillus amyloliquefaciens]MDR4377829.1 electron transfer flavoprotein subunit alpha/FixB family protein [Bacillus amyloliquefaciens]MEC1839671.1 electron transfer flavoprotein subunit alpha/FixB family protein [Bacillus amyloliquefaciens]MEC1847043.1 electron 
MGKKVIVLGEIRDGALRNVTFEAIAASKTISGGGDVIGVLMGKGAADAAPELIHYGADKVFTADTPGLSQYTADGYAAVLGDLIENEKPDAVIFGHTSMGKDLSPKLAARFETGLISDSTDVSVTGDNIVFTRPIYSGKAFEQVISTDPFILATIRPNNIQALEKDASRTGDIEELAAPAADLRTVIEEVVKKTADGVDLSEAKIIVAGGRGVKSKDGFEPLKELAEVLGAAVGASRGACDADYCDYSLQIGQTGKVVTPDLYIACGISGAIQHLAGMSNSKVIVAINKDPEAEIFKIADYGIVGDLFEVVPLLTQEFKNANIHS